MNFSKKQIRVICIVLAASLLLTIGISVVGMFSSVL